MLMLYAGTMTAFAPQYNYPYGKYGHLNDEIATAVEVTYNTVSEAVGDYYEDLRAPEYTLKRVYDPLLGRYRDVRIYA